MVMDNPTSFIPYEHPLVGVEEWFTTSFVTRSFWYRLVDGVSVWETNLGYQGTTACQGLQNRMQCRTQQVKWYIDSVASAMYWVSSRFYSWAYSSLQNILAHYSFRFFNQSNGKGA